MKWMLNVNMKETLFFKNETKYKFSSADVREAAYEDAVFVVIRWQSCGDDEKVTHHYRIEEENYADIIEYIKGQL